MIYFDNAATTFPKPENVIERVCTAMREFGGNPGRSAHRMSMIADREIFACRNALAQMFGALPERVIFTYNTTYALNAALYGIYDSGGILISDIEHNSVRRPALSLTKDVRIFDSFIEQIGEERTANILSDIKKKLNGVKILCCTAASNICGISMPIREIGELCRENGISFIVDGAQAGGVKDINVSRDSIDVLCLPGHKGLYGPMGTGVMILGENIDISPFVIGGSGVDSFSSEMPENPPERYEGGTLGVPSVVGLRAGVEFVGLMGILKISKYEDMLCKRFEEKLKNIGGKVYSPPCVERSGISLFNICIDCEETAYLLDKHGICVRGGYHCSPLAHRRLGIDKGAVRASFSVFNTIDEVDETADVIKKLINRPI